MFLTKISDGDTPLSSNHFHLEFLHSENGYDNGNTRYNRCASFSSIPPVEKPAGSPFKKPAGSPLYCGGVQWVPPLYSRDSDYSCSYAGRIDIFGSFVVRMMISISQFYQKAAETTDFIVIFRIELSHDILQHILYILTFTIACYAYVVLCFSFVRTAGQLLEL